jgi:tetratricopeptide (TPR) repeat protein
MLLALIAGAIYLDQLIIPKAPALFAPTATPTTNPESHLNEARQFFTDGKLIQAVDSYKKAIAANPTDQTIYTELARLQVWSGDFESALENAERSLVGNEDYALGHAVRGWVLNFQEDYVDALVSLRRALELDPNNVLAHAYLAEALINNGDYGDVDKASAESKTAMDLDPNLLETIRARAYVLFNTGNYQEALELYKRAIELNRYIPDLYLNLGYCYKFSMDLDAENANRAADAFLQANSLNPQSSVPDTELAWLYLSLGEYARAVQYAENAVKDSPTDSRRYGDLGIMYYKNKDYNQAITWLKFAVNGGTTDDGQQAPPLVLDYKNSKFYTYYGLALALVEPNRCAEAVPVFQAMLNSVPDDETAVINAQYGLDQCSSAPEEEATAEQEADSEP